MQGARFNCYVLCLAGGVKIQFDSNLFTRSEIFVLFALHICSFRITP